MTDQPLFFLVSFGASIIGAISGIGGGIIIKPVLEFASGHGVSVISFLSGCTVLSMSMVSLHRQKRSAAGFEPRRGTMLAFGAAIGGLAGKIAFDSMGERWGANRLGAVQSSLLVLITAGLLIYLAVENRLVTRNLQGSAPCLLLGASLGIVSSFLGFGGGPMNLAVLSYFLSMNRKTAALHSLYIIFFSQTANLLLTFVRGRVPDLSLWLLVCVILGGVAGGIVGSAIVKRLTSKGVGRMYAAVLVFVLCVSARNFWGYIAG